MLQLKNLKKSFGTRAAVDGLSIDVRRGEVYGLLGPNGAGKTTTINMAIGLLAPDSGSVELQANGNAGAPTDPQLRRFLGVATQALALYDDLSAEENLRLFGTLYGLKGSDLAGAARAALDRVGLADRARDRVKPFSGGMKRRLNLAIAFVHNPELILLDEPTAGVDPQSRNNILGQVRGLAAEGRTIIYTTHYMEEASRLCHRVGIIDHGKLLAEGTVDELIRAHGGRSAVVAERDGQTERIESSDPLSDISRLLEEGGVREVRIERPDLESVFLSLTGRSLRD